MLQTVLRSAVPDGVFLVGVEWSQKRRVLVRNAVYTIVERERTPACCDIKVFMSCHRRVVFLAVTPRYLLAMLFLQRYTLLHYVVRSYFVARTDSTNADT